MALNALTYEEKRAQAQVRAKLVESFETKLKRAQAKHDTLQDTLSEHMLEGDVSGQHIDDLVEDREVWAREIKRLRLKIKHG
jgi:hypothetical protein